MVDKNSFITIWQKDFKMVLVILEIHIVIKKLLIIICFYLINIEAFGQWTHFGVQKKNVRMT